MAVSFAHFQKTVFYPSFLCFPAVEWRFHDENKQFRRLTLKKGWNRFTPNWSEGASYLLLLFWLVIFFACFPAFRLSRALLLHEQGAFFVQPEKAVWTGFQAAMKTNKAGWTAFDGFRGRPLCLTGRRFRLIFSLIWSKKKTIPSRNVMFYSWQLEQPSTAIVWLDAWGRSLLITGWLTTEFQKRRKSFFRWQGFCRELWQLVEDWWWKLQGLTPVPSFCHKKSTRLGNTESGAKIRSVKGSHWLP